MSTQQFCRIVHRVFGILNSSLAVYEQRNERFIGITMKDKVHCTWGVGILAHKGVCIKEEMGKKVSVEIADREFEKKLRRRRGSFIVISMSYLPRLSSMRYAACPIMPGHRDPSPLLIL